MFDLILPYLIGLALGIAPEADSSKAPPPVSAQAAIDEGSGDDPATRTPEDQTPAGQFTTAAEVKPILGMTEANWVAVRAYEGQDLVYFTHLMAWRCGLWDIHYGLNGAPADQPLALEPCHSETAQPNGMTDVISFPPYITLPLNSVESIAVTLTFDDGTEQSASFSRAQVLIP